MQAIWDTKHYFWSWACTSKKYSTQPQELLVVIFWLMSGQWQYIVTNHFFHNLFCMVIFGHTDYVCIQNIFPCSFKAIFLKTLQYNNIWTHTYSKSCTGNRRNHNFKYIVPQHRIHIRIIFKLSLKMAHALLLKPVLTAVMS